MQILALEFSSPQRSVAVLDTAPQDPAVVPVERRQTGPDNRPLALIDAALAQAKLDRSQVECLVVGLGPGSYTGIRVAISIAQGWQLARAVRLLGISSVECLAHQARAEGLRGRVHVLLDAQRREFYLATYELAADSVTVALPLRLVTLAEAQAHCPAGETLIGPDVQSSFPQAARLCPQAATLARLAASHTDFVPGEQLEPIYLRAASFVKAPPPRSIPPL